MANKYWTGASSGDVTVGGNWVGGVAPSGGDSVYFTSGAVNATTGTLVNVVSFVVTAGYSGSIGLAGAPLTIGDVTTLRCAGPGANFFVTTAGTITAAYLDRGNVSIAGAGTLTAAYVGDATVSLPIATVTTLIGMTPASNITVETSANAITLCWSYGIVTVNSRTVTAATIIGSNGRIITTATAVLTTVNVDAGATYNKQSSTTDVTANIRGKGSLVTPVNNPNPLTPTITTVNVFQGGVFVQMAGGVGITVTNPINYFGQQVGPES